MRHGNSKESVADMFEATIPILPMRHGNHSKWAHDKTAPLIPILPMRHGNSFPRKLWGHISVQFRSYLWGMETKDELSDRVVLNNIPILPMRHGNLVGMNECVTNFPIPILPMRHGNIRVNVGVVTARVFRSYLWGMETQRRFWLWNLKLLIPILPMRHGNLP